MEEERGGKQQQFGTISRPAHPIDHACEGITRRDRDAEC